jgi:hypothetical protein
MSWNYRIFKKKIVYPEGFKVAPGEEYYYEIFEVYYNQNHEITAHSLNPIDLGAGSVEDLEKDLEMMLRDVKRFKEDILEADKITFAKDEDGAPDLSDFVEGD